jgi:hypothetical protein
MTSVALGKGLALPRGCLDQLAGTSSPSRTRTGYRSRRGSAVWLDVLAGRVVELPVEVPLAWEVGASMESACWHHYPRD